MVKNVLLSLHLVSMCWLEGRIYMGKLRNPIGRTEDFKNLNWYNFLIQLQKNNDILNCSINTQPRE